MKANAPKRKVFNDAVDLLMEDMPVVSGKGISEISVDKIKPFHNHPFHLYEGDRLDDMVESIKEHGILNPVIVMKMDAGFEMLSGHNRWNAAKLAGLKKIPAIVKEDLSEEEAYRREVPWMNCTDKQLLPWWQKYTLTLNEASEYFGIGYKKLKLFVQEHSDADFVLWNGNRALIKRELFQKYMDDQMNVI